MVALNSFFLLLSTNVASARSSKICYAYYELVLE